MPEIIYKRLITDKIQKYLYTDDIIVLHGARQVGKTYLLYYLKDELRKNGHIAHYIDLEDSRYVRILNDGITAFMHYLKEEGFDPEAHDSKFLYIFIDEIQYLDDPSSFLKLIADHHKKIKLIVSGSSSFEIKKKFTNSLVGRTVNFEIFPLSFEEFLIFKNYHFDKDTVFTFKKLDELKVLYREYVLYGSYPKIVLTDEIEKKEKYLQQIIDTYVKKDIRDLADIRDIEKFNKLLEALAAQSGNLLNITELSNTCHIAQQTVEKYLFILENTYVLKLVRPYSKNIRSELFKIPKIYFYDTGLMQILWLKNLPRTIMGNVFETSIFSELIKKYGKENIFYWRTRDKKEIDFILKMKNTIFPIEVKLNFQSFHRKAIAYFQEKYSVTEYHVISIEGEKKEKCFIYPWEI